METAKEKELNFLIGAIPYWETYLTDKQLEAMNLYLSCFDCSLVDDKLNLSNSTTYKRIFGDTSTSIGAIGRLRQAYQKLEKTGYFKKKEEKPKKITAVQLSDVTMQKTKKLFYYITKLQNWEQYLTQSQIEKMNYFIRVKNFKTAAKHFNITESSFKQALLGRNDKKNYGVLDKLETAYNSLYVNSWNDI